MHRLIVSNELECGKRFDTMTRLSQIAQRVFDRRSALAAAALLALPRLPGEDAAAKKRRRKRKKKVTLCVDGQTVKIGKKQQANYLAAGATKGACTCLNPSQSLQEAINAANPGATLELCSGQWNLPGKVTIAKNLTLVGAGAGQTILRGSGDDRVLELQGLITLKSLTVTNGNALRAQARNGGGIYCDGTLTMFDSNVQGNTASDRGGGIFVGFGSITLIRTTVAQNTAQFGGGICNPIGLVYLTSSQITENTATDGGGLYNGGPLLEGSINGSPGSITLDAESTVRGNVAQRQGGGLFVEQGKITLTGSRVTQNRANEGGGAFITAEGTLTLESGASVINNTPTNCAGANIPGTCVG